MSGAGGGATIFVVMGVAGVGKTTVGEAAAARLGWAFLDGDQLHPAANVAKMSAGQPLTDTDRAPWLDACAAEIAAWREAGTDAVITCSALKRAYRDRLRGPGVRFVYLDASPALVDARLAARTGHFWDNSLAPSQFAALEPPTADEAALVLDAALSVDDLAAAIAAAA
jgi:carbohydrate kinase (thermoresistant glucokinase family)